MMHRRFIGFATPLAVCLLALNACAGGPVYQPLTVSHPLFGPTAVWGYAQIPLATDYFEVEYTVRGSGNLSSARYYATVRAAELAVQHGKLYFEVIEAGPWENPQNWAAIASSAAATRPAHPEGLLEYEAGELIELNYANSPIVIHLVGAQTPGALDALDVARQAKRNGIVFGPEVEERLAAPDALAGGQ